MVMRVEPERLHILLLPGGPAPASQGSEGIHGVSLL